MLASDTALSDPALTRHIFLMHTAIKQDVAAILSDATALKPLAPDLALSDLERRVHRLNNTVLAHCRIEDDLLFPTLQLAAQSHSSTQTHSPRHSPPPSKRPRTSFSPASIDFHAVEQDHSLLARSFTQLRHALADMRATPLHRTAPFSLVDTHSSTVPTGKPREQSILAVVHSARQLSEAINVHLTREEITILPAGLDKLSIPQRATLLLSLTNAAISVPLLCDALCSVPEHDLAALCNAVADFCELADLHAIARHIAQGLSTNRWKSLCAQVPTFPPTLKPERNPLIGILHMHKAISIELRELVVFCENLDLAHPKQLHILYSRMNFLKTVHKCHAHGEESVLLKELHAKLQSAPHGEGIHQFHDSHDDETALFDRLAEKQARFQEQVHQAKHDEHRLLLLKEDMVKSVLDIADHLSEHMMAEEENILPLIRKHFSVDDQDRMMRSVMAVVPSDLLQEIIPWIFKALDQNERELMIRDLLASAPRSEVEKVVGFLTDCVHKGRLGRDEWNEMRQRVPEIEESFKSAVEKVEDDGPVSEILRVHKAFRLELEEILQTSKELCSEGTIPNPNVLVSLAEEVALLRRMVSDHADAEDEVILPRLEQRVPGICAEYKDVHVDEKKLFKDLADCIGELRCLVEDDDCGAALRKLHALAQTLRDEMESHLTSEEEHMWPKLKEHFTLEEQTETVAMVFGRLPAHRFRELLPWMIRKLSVIEGNKMIDHILQVTRSTMFETWLKSWLPLNDKGESCTEKIGSETKECTTVTSGTPRSSTAIVGGQGEASTARWMLNGRVSMERTIRSIAQDTSLTAEDRTRMIQNVMLVPYHRLCDEARTEGEKEMKNLGDLSRTYYTGKDGVKRFGCRHYQRACKLRAACCGELHTCRLCHDEAVQTHIMDRHATKEIMCMYCQTLQAPTGSCTNKKCGKRLAKYFCDVCVFYDDHASRSVYHCHSCNVCRAGKGLGIDFFHCMKCNQCMSMKYDKTGHVCLERAMESNCPVCHLYLFTSTRPVKHLRCGHLIHASCFNQYRRRTDGVRCPVCSKSLTEMKPVYEEIDRQIAAGGALGMPEEYRTARCKIYCYDCQGTSDTSYNFYYNKCSQCPSYNTRVDHIDANAGDSRGQSDGV